MRALCGWLLAAGCLCLLGAPSAVAQTAVSTEAATPATSVEGASSSPNAAAGPAQGAAAARRAQAQGVAPADAAAATPGEAAKKKPATKEADGPPPVKRPTEPATPADPKELDVLPDADGRVAFSFKGQPWPAVLEWLADISSMTLEWQEAPPGYLDLTTRGDYTIAEVRDRINYVLLARGYTLLDQGEILTLVKLDKLDASLVPRVSSEGLDARGAFELVRTFFDLDTLLAAQVAEEIKPMLSAHGKATPLVATNRLDVLDTARNLRRIRDLLIDEQSSGAHARLVREFRLVHTQAAEVMATLKTLLGVEDSPKNQPPMTPEQMQQQQMMAQQQAARAGANRGAAPADAGGQDEKKIHLAINVRENSLLANAPADRMAVIEQAVQLLDVPRAGGGSLLGNLPRFQVYRLSGIEPEPLVKVLRDLGNLDPTTRLEIDAKNRAIMAYAPLADHVTIRALVERLDGSGRQFEVIQLRRLDAEYVAGSIEHLMKGPQEKKESSRYSYYYGYSDRSSQEQKTDDFRVEADIEFNRLLLRANEVEMEEVRTLLVKLGEITEDGRSGRPVRVVPVSPGEEMDRLIERLERLWPSVSPNPLEVEPIDEAANRNRSRTKSTPAATDATEIPARRTTPRWNVATQDADAASPERMIAFRERESAPGEQLADPPFDDFDAAGDADRATAGAAPPVSILRGDDGIIISSRDSAALDLVEDLLAEIRSSQVSYKVFPLVNTFARDVVYLLEDIFEQDEKDDSNNDFNSWYWGYPTTSSTDDRAGRLSRKRPVKFVADPVTNTVLVQNADTRQLKEIESLIALYDRAEPPDSKSVRVTDIVQLHFAKAEEIRDVVKDVYRDLLSPNDKALATPGGQRQQQEEQRPRTTYTYVFGGAEDESENLPRFKGLLSVGVDTRSNSVIVSAPQYLLSIIVQMVHTLDEQARATRPVVRVVEVGGSLHDLKGALSGVLNKNAEPSRPSRGEMAMPHREPMQDGSQPQAEEGIE